MSAVISDISDGCFPRIAHSPTETGYYVHSTYYVISRRCCRGPSQPSFSATSWCTNQQCAEHPCAMDGTWQSRVTAARCGPPELSFLEVTAPCTSTSTRLNVRYQRSARAGNCKPTKAHHGQRSCNTRLWLQPDMSGLSAPECEIAHKPNTGTHPLRNEAHKRSTCETAHVVQGARQQAMRVITNAESPHACRSTMFCRPARPLARRTPRQSPPI